MKVLMYERFEKHAALRAALLGSMAILTLIFPQILFDAIVYVLAGYVMLNGILSIMEGFRNKKAPLFGFSFAAGCLLIIAGILMAVYFRRLVSILPVFLGVFAMLEGVIYFVTAIGAGGNKKGLLLLLAVLIALGGMTVVLVTFGGLMTLSRVFGVVLLLSCAYELVSYFICRKTVGQSPNLTNV